MEQSFTARMPLLTATSAFGEVARVLICVTYGIHHLRTIYYDIWILAEMDFLSTDF